jgi:6-pyruvoyltetrahydropterin/6-carboxytetrahydropterin synthase
MLITRRLEFDAGHRIPDHASQCRHLHGHRYVLEITVRGKVIDSAGRADNGMVLDFSDVKSLAKEHVVDPWDHSFLCWKADTRVAEFLATLPDHKTVLMDSVPTAENLAQAAFGLIDKALINRYGDALSLETVRLYETPNCWADIDRASFRESTRNN